MGHTSLLFHIILDLRYNQQKLPKRTFHIILSVQIQTFNCSMNAPINVQSAVSPTTAQHVWMDMILKAQNASKTRKMKLAIV